MENSRTGFNELYGLRLLHHTNGLACVVDCLIRYKAVANGPVGQVLAGPLFLKVNTKFHFTKSK